MTEQHRHLDREAVAARLRDTPLFGGLDDEAIHRLCAMGEIRDLESGTLLIREGDEADALYVVLDGEMVVTKRSGSTDVELARVGPGSLQGEIAALEGGERLASVRAVTTAEVLRIPVAAVRELLGSSPEVALSIIRTAVGRLRSMELALREREKLAALGTLAAGLAHELNNPAAAAMRTIDGLLDTIRSAERLPRPSPPPEPPAQPPPASALERADRIDAVMSLGLDAEAAAALVGAGWTADALRQVDPAYHPWLAADAAVHAQFGELTMAVGRISEIVAAVKGYAYLDQAPVQRIDVRTGLEQTLVILRHRLRDGIEVRREMEGDLPEIEAYGSELNQVWTNLVDNAIDAMEGRGVLTVRAAPATDGAGVVVTICDTGPGIPEKVRSRLFEPFYTTKPPGKGTGLGLHISHQVVARHGGSIEVSSSPEGTCFEVTLPLRPPDAAPPGPESEADGREADPAGPETEPA